MQFTEFTHSTDKHPNIRTCHVPTSGQGWGGEEYNPCPQDPGATLPIDKGRRVWGFSLQPYFQKGISRSNNASIKAAWRSSSYVMGAFIVAKINELGPHIPT